MPAARICVASVCSKSLPQLVESLIKYVCTYYLALSVLSAVYELEARRRQADGSTSLPNAFQRS